MCIKPSITINSRKASILIRTIESQISSIALQSVNDYAFDLRKELASQTKKKVNRPVPWIQRAWRVDKANSKSNICASVSIKDPLKVDYFKQIINGGEGVPTILTKQLQQRGLVKHNQTVVGSPNIKRNKYGNVPRSIWNRSAKGVRTKGNTFVRPGEGIYTSNKKKLTPTFLFVPKYRSRGVLNLDGIVTRSVRRFSNILLRDYTSKIKRISSKI